MSEEYLTVTETAKLVRAALKREFPGVKFSVRSDRYAGGSSIRVGWTDGPRTAVVDEVTGPFAGSRFDGMQDMKTSRSAWLSEDGTATSAVDGEPAPEGARLVQFMADYVFTERTFSAEYRRELERAVVFLSGAAGPFDGNKRYEFGVIPEGEVAGKAYSDYGSTAVFQLSQVEEATLASALRSEAARRAKYAFARFNEQAGEPKTGYYVTVVDAGLTGALLGPYGTKGEAEVDVPLGRLLARSVNSDAIWYAYGVTKVTMRSGADLPQGRLEHLVARQMAVAEIAYPVPQAA